MKNNIKNIILSSVAIFGLQGCSEEYLEKNPSEDLLSTTQVKEVSQKDPSLTEALVTGMYSYMSQESVGGRDRDEDFGQKANDIISDMLSCDMAYTSAYYRYGSIAKMESMENYSSYQHYMLWRYYYKVIAQANGIIDNAGGNNVVPAKKELKEALGQAKAMRAYAYFYLATYYTKSYEDAKDKKIIVLYDKVEKTAKGQSTTKEVMDLVVKDLKDAIALLGEFDRSNKYAVNKAVAEGLLAYTYGYMGEYDKVIPLCKSVIDNGGFPISQKADLYNGMNDMASSPNWMWGLDIIPDMNYGLRSFWGQMDIYSYSYSAFGGYKRMDNALLASMNSKDLRLQQFSDENLVEFGVPLPKGLPYKKFYDSDRVFQGATKVIKADVVYMRVEEFYLLKAEAEAKLDQDVNAIETLKPLLAERYASAADYSYVLSKTGDDLDAEIYLQTKLEFWGEGKSYMAMKRNKAKVKRSNNHSFGAGVEFNYDDNSLTFMVPKSEIENNPNVSN